MLNIAINSFYIFYIVSFLFIDIYNNMVYDDDAIMHDKNLLKNINLIVRFKLDIYGFG